MNHMHNTLAEHRQWPFYNIQQKPYESIPMSCHYSCSACSGSYYYDLCTACPATRTLLAGTCPCSSAYYEYQKSQCTASDSLTAFDSSLINVATFAYYAAIGLHLLIIVLTINRILSIKLKKIIDTCQVVGLIHYYRFVQTGVASKGLKILDAFNFNYFTNLVCTTSAPPYGCSGFENLIGVGFTLLAFFCLILLSYLVGYCIYNFQTDSSNVIYIKNGKQTRGGKEDSLGCLTYWDSLSSSVFLLYLDNTVIQTTMSISRIAIINYQGILIVIPFLILIVLIVRTHFTTINDPKQTTLAYRATHNYFYYYDEYYHLSYIDHMFDDDNMDKNGQSLKKPFYPQSNLIIIEILFKILLATSVIVFYQYQPYLFAFCCIFLVVTYSCSMKVFFTYQIFDLWLYYIFIAVHVFSNIFFTTSTFFSYFIIFTAFSLQILAVIFIIFAISSWKKEKQGEMFKKTFQLSKEKSNRVSNLEESENQVMSNTHEEQIVSNIDQDQILPMFSNEIKAQAGRQNTVKHLSRNQSIPNISVLSKKKESEANLNESQAPKRRITRQTFNNESLTNKLALKSKKSEPQLLQTINEPPKQESSEYIVPFKKRSVKNVLVPQESQNLE